MLQHPLQSDLTCSQSADGGHERCRPLSWAASAARRCPGGCVRRAGAKRLCPPSRPRCGPMAPSVRRRGAASKMPADACCYHLGPNANRSKTEQNINPNEHKCNNPLLPSNTPHCYAATPPIAVQQHPPLLYSNTPPLLKFFSETSTVKSISMESTRGIRQQRPPLLTKPPPSNDPHC
jgi:hypothetical protein